MQVNSERILRGAQEQIKNEVILTFKPLWNETRERSKVARGFIVIEQSRQKYLVFLF